MSDAARISVAAREWLGVPYHHQGRNGFGLDCIGLLVMVGKAIGSFDVTFDFTNYGREPNGELVKQLDVHLEPLPWQGGELVVPGCVVALRWFEAPHHVGIVIDGPGYPLLIHSHAAQGGVKQHRFGRWHQKRITGVYKFRGTTL